MCEIEVDEYCTVWRETSHKARKFHKCSCCRGPIDPGETYVVHFSLFDGSATSEKCCPDCETDREIFAAAHGGFRTSPGYFPQQVADCISEGDPEDSQWESMLGRIHSRRKGGA